MISHRHERQRLSGRYFFDSLIIPSLADLTNALTAYNQQTGLSIKRQVKRKLTSRDEVYAYLTKHLNDEDVQRLRRSELVLKKFGFGAP